MTMITSSFYAYLSRLRRLTWPETNTEFEMTDKQLPDDIQSMRQPEVLFLWNL